MQLVTLSADSDARYIGPVSEWILDAGNPHLQWLYMDDRERALNAIRNALAFDRSELWIGHVSLLLDDDGEPIGGFLALPGRELRDRRRADLADLIRLTSREERTELRDRLELGKDVYLPVDPNHRFLSKIGLLPKHRGHGLGAKLLDSFIAASWEDGYEHVRLDVNRSSDRIVSLYESRGFRVVGARALPALGVEYLAMTLTRSHRV